MYDDDEVLFLFTSEVFKYLFLKKIFFDLGPGESLVLLTMSNVKD